MQTIRDLVSKLFTPTLTAEKQIERGFLGISFMDSVITQSDNLKNDGKPELGNDVLAVGLNLLRQRNINLKKITDDSFDRAEKGASPPISQENIDATRRTIRTIANAL